MVTGFIPSDADIKAAEERTKKLNKLKRMRKEDLLSMVTKEDLIYAITGSYYS